MISVFNPMKTLVVDPAENKDVTFTCWAYSQMRNDGGEYRASVIHMQGWQVGRDTITACGLKRSKTVTAESLSDGYNYSDTDVHPSQWQGCRRCQAAYRAWAKKQKKVSAE